MPRVPCTKIAQSAGPIPLEIAEYDFPDQSHWNAPLKTERATLIGFTFVPNTAVDEIGLTVPYLCLGQTDYVNHTGEKPISITWSLRRPTQTPADAYAAAAAVL